MTGQFEAAALRRDERLLGHNHPPGPIDYAREAMAELGVFLKDYPVIQSPADAKQGGAFVERTRIALNELETERAVKVGPLNAQLTKINGAYRMVRDPLEKVLRELKRRLTDYATAEEAKRQAEAARLRAEAEAQEAAARAAEAAEQDAIAQADVGVLDVDVGAAITEADAAFGDYARADRAAAVAERDSKVRITSAMGGKALSMRSVEVLVISNIHAALKAMAITPKIKEAVLSSARDYRKEFGELPTGIEATQQRSL